MEISDLGDSTIQQRVMDFSFINESITNTFPCLGSLPDFELSELRLRPRISTVDLGEVKSV